MVLRCTVRGCKTGTVADIRQKTRAGLKLNTVFTSPKLAAMIEKWSTALNQEITPNDKICELHFADLDVLRSDDTILPDGTVFSLPRHKVTLRKGAVPLDHNNQENKVPKYQGTIMNHEATPYSLEIKCFENELFEEVESSNELQIDTESSEMKETLIETTASFVHDCDNEPQEQIIINTSIIDQIRNSILNDHQYFLDESKPGQYYYFNKEVAASFTIPTFKNKINEKQQTAKIYKNNNLLVQDIDISEENNDESTTKNLLEEDGSSNDLLPLSKKKPFLISSPISVESLKIYLCNNPLPRTWSWMSYTEKDNGITFIQIDCKTKKIRCYVEIYEDFTVLIQTADKEIGMEIDFEIPFVESILKILETVGKMKICTGTGIQEKNRDKYCTGVVTPGDEYKISMQCDRCMACRKARNTVMKNAIKPQIDLKAKYKLTKMELDHFKRTCRRFQETISLKNKKLKTLKELIRTSNKYNRSQYFETDSE